MPEALKITAHPQVGPSLSATTWVGMPVVGATTTFMINVSRLNEPVENANVTLRIFDSFGGQIYPPSGAVTIPPHTMPGTYLYTSALTNIFLNAGDLYILKWFITVPQTLTEPQLVLPLTQKVIAQEP